MLRIGASTDRRAQLERPSVTLKVNVITDQAPVHHCVCAQQNVYKPEVAKAVEVCMRMLGPSSVQSVSFDKVREQTSNPVNIHDVGITQK